MNKFAKTLVSLSFLVLYSTHYAQEVSANLSLSEVLSSTKLHQVKKQSSKDEINTHQFLATSPKLYVSYLDAGDIQGEETEIGISLDLTSLAKHRLNDQFIAIEPRIKSVNERNLDIFYSGLIRTLLWDMAISQKQQQQADNKIEWLTGSEQFLSQLLEKGVGSKMALLRVQLELTKLQQEKAKSVMTYQTGLGQYQSLTYLNALPDKIIEVLSSDTEILPSHPLLEKIVLTQQLAFLELKTGSTNTEDWSMTLFQKEVDIEGRKDTQVGMSVEFPISFSDSYQPSAYQVWRIANTEYDQQYLEANTNLVSRFRELQQEQQYLTKIQDLLSKKLALSKELEVDLEKLKQSRTVSLDEYYKRLIELKDIQFQSELNELHLYQNIARQNQTLGQTL